MAEKNCENCARENCLTIPPNGMCYCDYWRSCENPEPRWIPCSEMMPKDHKRVLVYLTEESKVETAEKVPAGWYFKSGLIIHESKASYWMPLPEPPVTESAEQPVMPAIIPDGTDITSLPSPGVYTTKTAAEQYIDFFKGRSKDELFAAIRDVEEDDGI